MIKECKRCGKEFEWSQLNRKYCPECSKMTYYERNREKKTPKKKTPQPPGTVNCQPNSAVRKKCKFACGTTESTLCCDYLSRTGNRRGCPAEQCDKFEAGDRRRKAWSNYKVL